MLEYRCIALFHFHFSHIIHRLKLTVCNAIYHQLSKGIKLSQFHQLKRTQERENLLFQLNYLNDYLGVGMLPFSELR